jgi:prolyl oligopeptidase
MSFSTDLGPLSDSINSVSRARGHWIKSIANLTVLSLAIGAAWIGDYGSPDDPEDFDYLYRYSPIHNVRSDKVYPPVMLLTGDHDDRVSPLHSFKLISALQHQLADNPNALLLRVALKAGHGAGKSTQQRIDEATDRFSFAATSMGLAYKEAAQSAHM